MILDGKKLANKILGELKKEVKNLPPIKLAVVLVGDNYKSLKYIKQKEKAAKKINIKFELYKFDSKISNQNLIKEINKVVNDKTNTGIVIQLPLPSRIDTGKILALIPPEKDAELESPTASGIMKLLEEYNINVKEKKVVIVGKGRLVGQPLAEMMKKAAADLLVCDSKTKNLDLQTLKADILVSATGQPCLIKENMVKKEAVVIDVGTGDVDFEKVKNKAAYITPPIGGVGPMTVAMLMKNLLKLAKL